MRIPVLLVLMASIIALTCVGKESAPPGGPDEGKAERAVLRSPILEGSVMIRESLDELAPDSSAVLHVRANQNDTSDKMQGIEVFFFTGRHPHAVAMNVVSQVQPTATADTIRGMKITTQNLGAADSLVMYGMDVRMRCSMPGAHGSVMIPLWVHTEEILGGAYDLVSRPILVTAPHRWKSAFASHVAFTGEGPIHATRGAIRCYKNMDPGERIPDPIDPTSGPGDVVAEGRVIAGDGIVLPALRDEEAKPGVLYFSEKEKALRFRGPDGTLYRVRLEEIRG